MIKMQLLGMLHNSNLVVIITFQFLYNTHPLLTSGKIQSYR